MSEYRRLEDLSDSDEEVHPNIDTKSFRKFIKEQRAKRLEELRNKENLTTAESKELQELEYKALPVVKEVPEESFRVAKEEDSSEDYSKDLEILLNNFRVEFFIEHVERKNMNLNAFENLVDVNMIEYMKEDSDEIGLLLMKISLFSKWLREFGKTVLLKISRDEGKLNEIVKDQYEASKIAILKLKQEI